MLVTLWEKTVKNDLGKTNTKWDMYWEGASSLISQWLHCIVCFTNCSECLLHKLKMYNTGNQRIIIFSLFEKSWLFPFHSSSMRCHGVERRRKIKPNPGLRYFRPLPQNEAWCSTVYMKISSICIWMKTYNHMKGRAPGLTLKKRPR